MGVALGGALLLYALRAPDLKGGGLFAPISREGSLLLNNLLMATATATVLLGTLYPMFADALNLGKVTVGPPFFNAVFVPLMIPLIIAMGFGPLLSWKRGDITGALGRLKAAAAAALLAFGLAWVLAGGALDDALAAVGFGLAVWLLVATLVELAERVKLFRAPLAESGRRFARLPRAAFGMTLAHAGMAFIIAGVTASSAYKQESVQVMVPGETVTVAGYQFTFQGAERVEGPNYSAIQGHFSVAKDGEGIAVLDPQKRQYTSPPMPTTEAAIHTNGWADLYAVVGDPNQDGPGFVTRIYFEPLVPFLWYGAMLMGLGGIVSLTDRRHRVGAPSRRKVAATTAKPRPASA